MKENGFTLANTSRRYPVETIMDQDDRDDIAFLANTIALAESMLYRLEKGAAGIVFHINADKTEYIYFNQKQR